MKDPYEILGISPTASDEEVKAAYRALARKYHPDNFDDSNPLKELATEKMQEINQAYDEILCMRQASSKGAKSSGCSGADDTYTSGSSDLYNEIRNKINRGRIIDAENLLRAVPEDERIAEWHYLISLVLFKRGRVNDAMRELELACMMDPSNIEYQKAKQMFNTTSNGYGSTYYGDNGSSSSCCSSSSSDDVCNTCLHLALCDCICECLGGDLIPCL